MNMYDNQPDIFPTLERNMAGNNEIRGNESDCDEVIVLMPLNEFP